MLLPAQIIQRKRDGTALTEEEIRFFVGGFTRGEIPDYQMAALAMAICFQGMNFDETMWLTRAMVESGKTIEWRKGQCLSAEVPKYLSHDPSSDLSTSALRHLGTSALSHLGTGFYCDKHSTGGIGDKVSLILAPLVASCGVKVPMISGRGLGPTGGTLDKLESIPGFRTDLSLPELVRVTEEVGCCITGATPEIAPADKKLYALRDVTATVSCLPLIVASIMSKKLAENVDGLVLDVKWGSGAFMKTRAASAELARAMVEVGKRYGKKVVALQTDMNQPLGQMIGNALEVRECLDVLAGNCRATAPVAITGTAAGGAPALQSDLLAVTLALGAEMIFLAGATKSVEAGRDMLQKKLASGDALKKFLEMVAAQGGDPQAGESPDRLPTAKQVRAIESLQSGWVEAIACDQLGYAVIALGGGRKMAGERINYGVGFAHPRKIGERVEAGEPLALMHYTDETSAAAAEQLVQAAYRIGMAAPATKPELVVQRFD
jgi:pyrimidine-nucleoside phosphorylase